MGVQRSEEYFRRWGADTGDPHFRLNAPEADEDDAAEHPQNTSGWAPTEYRALVLPDEIEEKSKGGIIIPDAVKDMEKRAQMEGVLVAVGGFAFTEGGEKAWPERQMLVPGARVMFAKYAGAPFKGRDGKEYRLLSDKDVAAVSI